MMKRRNKLLCLFALLLVLGGSAAVFRVQLLEPLAKRFIIHAVARELGLEITVGKISGSYFRDLKITGIRTVKPSPNGMLVSFGADSLQARYSLASLAEGMESFFSGLTLEVDGARVALDLTRDWNVHGGEEESPASDLKLPRTRVLNSALELRGGDWSLSLAGMELTVSAPDDRQGGIPLEVRAAESAIELPHLRRQTPELAARGLLSLDWVRIDDLEVNGRQAVEKARFDYATGQPVRGTVLFSAFGGSGEVKAKFHEESTELGWDLRNITLSSVDSLLDLQEPSPSGLLTSSGRLSGRLSEPVSWRGFFSLDVNGGSIHDRPFSRIALAGKAAEGSLLLDTLRAETADNIVTASSVSIRLAPLLAGEAEKTLRSLTGSFQARLDNIPALLDLLGVKLPPKYFPAGVPSHRLVLAGLASGEGITLESGTFNAGDGQVTVERLVAHWPRTGPLLEGLRLSAKFKGDIPDLGSTATLFGLDDVAGNLQGEGTFEGPLKDIRGNIELNGKDLRYRQFKASRLLLEARSDQAEWRIINLEIDRGDDRLTGSGTLATAPFLFKGMAFDLRVKDIRSYLDWLPNGGVRGLPSRGALEAHLVLSGFPKAPVGSFGAVLTAAEFAGVAVSRAELTATMSGETVEVTRLLVQTPEGEVEAAGSFRHQGWELPLAGAVNRLVLIREEPFLRLLAPVTFRVEGKSRWSLTEAKLSGEGGNFSLRGDVSPQRGCKFSFRLAGVQSEPWISFFPDLPLKFRGLELAGTVSGALETPTVTLAGRVPELLAANATEPLAGEVDLRFSAVGVDLETFSWTTKTGAQISLEGNIPYNPFARRFLQKQMALKGLFVVPDLEVFTSFLPAEFRLPGSLNGTITITGKGEHPEAAVVLHARDLRLPDVLKLRPPAALSVDAEMVLRDNDLHLIDLTAHGADLNLAASGNWRQAGDWLTRPRETGLPGSLDLRATLSVSDLGWMARAFPAIRRLGGKVDGTLALSGPVAEPEISADLALAGGEVRAENAIPPLRNLQAHLIVKRRTATVKRFTGTVGGSPFTVAGSVDLSEEGGAVADLSVRGSNLLLYRSENLGVRGDADITVRGSLMAPTFAGTVAITDGMLRKNLDWLETLRDLGHGRVGTSGSGNVGGSVFSFHNPPLKDATFDIRLTSRSPFVVKSNVARGELRPDLRLQGTGELPTLIGVIYIDPSRVQLPGGRMAINSGLIRFPENSPGRPQLEISGSSRILGYDINVTVEGNYDEPTISLSSVPPLPQDQLLLLLLTGKLPPGTTVQQGGWQEGGMKVALYVGQGVLAEWFGSNDLDREESLLDRFDVVVGRGISRQGNETVGAQYRLADGVIRDGDQLYLVAERDIYDEFNAGLRIVFHFK